MKLSAAILLLLLINAGGCHEAASDTTAATATTPMGMRQDHSAPAVAAHSGAFDARLEADTLADFWGTGAEIRRLYSDEAIAFEVNVATSGRTLTARFVEQNPVEVNFFTGNATAEDAERMRGYLKHRYPNAEWKPALGHLAGDREEQWQILPLADRASK
jgi:hypothetical protein